jgi:colanic acid/amylovoran biosynthesis glycosyltransferase
MRCRDANRPHLLEVAVRWPPETFVGWMLEGLAARGMSVTLASRQVEDPDATVPGVELVELPSGPRTPRGIARILARYALPLLLTMPRRLLRLVRAVRRASPPLRRRHGGTLGLLALCVPLARFRPDLVKFEWNTAASDYLPLYEIWDCPVVTSCRGSDTSVYPHIPVLEHYALMLPDVMAGVDAAHCISESLKREAVGFGLEPAKATVIRPGVDPDLFRPAADGGEPDGPMSVLMVGWLRWEKGYEYALQAIRALMDRGVAVRLEILGTVPAEKRRPSDEADRIHHTIEDLGLDGQVHLNGHASSVEVSRRLQASDVYLHPSLTEGIPAAVIEAMACGVAVVATGCGGVPEAVTDGVEGLLVPPRDPERLADALQRLARDPELRSRMGEAGRARVLSEFTLEREHEAFFGMFRELIAARNGGFTRAPSDIGIGTR